MLFGGGDVDNGEWNARSSWYKRSSAVVLGWRREYTVLFEDGVEAGDGGNDTEKRVWWDAIMVGVGSISNLYVPAGDICELEPGSTGLGAIPEEEGIELLAM